MTIYLQPFQILRDNTERMFGPYVTNWIAALVCWPHVGVWRTWTSLLVRYGCVRLDSMAVKDEKT